MGQWYITDVNSMKKFFLGILSVLLFSTSLVSCSGDNSANPQDPGAGNYEFVDLGLSVKWAKCNIGANVPQDFGAYFSWGETEPKSSYTWENYKWCEGAYNSLTKYCTDAIYGKVDNKTVLDLNDDAANFNWRDVSDLDESGKPFTYEDFVDPELVEDFGKLTKYCFKRMPTATEFEELIENCEWVWSTVEKVKGYTIISKINGNSIFLPAAGAIEIPSIETQGSIGYYYSSDLRTDLSTNAIHLTFYEGGRFEIQDHERRYGFTIRPVAEEKYIIKE